MWGTRRFPPRQESFKEYKILSRLTDGRTVNATRNSAAADAAAACGSARTSRPPGKGGKHGGEPRPQGKLSYIKDHEGGSDRTRVGPGILLKYITGFKEKCPVERGWKWGHSTNRRKTRKQHVRKKRQKRGSISVVLFSLPDASRPVWY